MTQTIFDQLRTLDAAPATSITHDDAERREALLGRILDSSATAAPVRRRATLVWASLAAGAMLAGAAAFGAVILMPHLSGAGHDLPTAASGPLSSAELASWTSAPTTVPAGSGLAAEAQAWCETSLGAANGTGGTPVVTNLELRGSVASLIYERQGLVYYCLNGGYEKGLWEIVDGAPIAALAPTQAVLSTAGTFGNDSAALTYALGFVGPDVVAVTLNEPGHEPITATVDGGRWTAWWPTPDTSVGGLTGDITVTAADGSTQTAPADSMREAG
jgi:hypothetical protein